MNPTIAACAVCGTRDWMTPHYVPLSDLKMLALSEEEHKAFFAAPSMFT